MCACVNSLKASSDFKRISRLGKRCVFPVFIMLALKRKEDDTSVRLGLTVSRKVGNAVIRNRTKRRLREVVRQCLATKEPLSFDIVLIGRKSAKERDFSLIKEDFLHGLKRLKVTA